MVKAAAQMVQAEAEAEAVVLETWGLMEDPTLAGMVVTLLFKALPLVIR